MNTLSGQSHATWGHYIDEIIRQEKRRIRDQVLTMYQNDRIENQKQRSSSRPESSPDETRRLLAGCNTTAQHLWCPLPFTMIYLLLFPYPSKNDILGAAAFCCFYAPDIPAGQSAPSVYVCTACFRVSRHQDVPVVPTPHRITREWYGPE